MGVRDWKDSSEKWTAREQKVEEWDKRIEAIERAEGEEGSEKRGILSGLFGKMKKGTGKTKPDGTVGLRRVMEAEWWMSDCRADIFVKS